MTFLMQPEKRPVYQVDIEQSKEHPGETCIHCGQSAVTFKRVPLTYKVQMRVFDAVTYYGTRDAERRGLHGTLYEVWLRVSPGGLELEGKWITNSPEEAVVLAFTLREEFKVRDKSFVLGMGSGSKQTDSPSEMKVALDKYAVEIDAYRARKKEVISQ